MSKYLVTDEEIIAELNLVLSDDGESEGELSELEDDVVEESEHDSASDLTASSNDESVTGVGGNYYQGKDGTTKWSKQPFSKRGRATKQNIISHLPGPRPIAKSVKTPIEAFSLFFDDHVMDTLVMYTNMYIMKICENYERSRDARVTDRVEMNAFIGLLLFAGTYRASHLHFKDMWDQDGPQIFSVTMSYERFLFLLRCIRFDNLNDRNDRRKFDKLAAIREILTFIGENYLKAYTPAEYLTIDEQLIPFRGRCPFRQYLPNKPKKYGIKVFALVDSRTFYLLKFEVYVGRQPDGPFVQSNSPSDVVQRFVAPIRNSGRNITTDNWYTNIPLAKALLQERLTLVGTLRKNKREIPIEFLPNKHREINSSLFGFTKEISMVSYVTRKAQAVVLISTMHNDNTIDEDTGSSNKPEIVTFYNCTKGGVDSCDQLCSNYSVGRRTRRWPLAVFFHFINVSALNSYILYKMNTKQKTKRRTFLNDLAKELVMENIVRRMNNPHISRSLRDRIKIFLLDRGIEVPQQQNQATRNASAPQKRKRCHICPSTTDNKHSTQCTVCMGSVCKTHYNIVCTKCGD